jgi:hypothetical protein
MDMFVYGCSRVIRHFSLANETVLVYNTEDILNDLKIPFTMFKQIAILSGTDYNTNDNISLYETLKWYKEFSSDESNIGTHTNQFIFYEWLHRNTKYIRNFDHLIEIHKLFDVDMHITKEDYKTNNVYSNIKIRKIMDQYGFIFV